MAVFLILTAQSDAVRQEYNGVSRFQVFQKAVETKKLPIYRHQFIFRYQRVSWANRSIIWIAEFWNFIHRPVIFKTLKQDASGTGVSVLKRGAERAGPSHGVRQALFNGRDRLGSPASPLKMAPHPVPETLSSGFSKKKNWTMDRVQKLDNPNCCTPLQQSYRIQIYYYRDFKRIQFAFLRNFMYIYIFCFNAICKDTAAINK